MRGLGLAPALVRRLGAVDRPRGRRAPPTRRTRSRRFSRVYLAIVFYSPVGGGFRLSQARGARARVRVRAPRASRNAPRRFALLRAEGEARGARLSSVTSSVTSSRASVVVVAFVVSFSRVFTEVCVEPPVRRGCARPGVRVEDRRTVPSLGFSAAAAAWRGVRGRLRAGGYGPGAPTIGLLPREEGSRVARHRRDEVKGGAGPPVVERRTLSRSAIVVVLLVVVGFEMARGLGRGRALRGRRPPPMPRRGGRWRTRGRATFPQLVPVSLPQRLPRRTPGGARPNKSTGRPGITTRGLLPPRGPRRQRPTAHRRCVSLFPRWTAVPTAAGQIKTHLDRQRDRRGKFLGELCPNT